MNRPADGRENELELEGMMASWALQSSDLMRPPVTVKFANFPLVATNYRLLRPANHGYGNSPARARAYPPPATARRLLNAFTFSVTALQKPV